MKLHQFREALDQLKATNSRNKKKQIVRECADSTAAISFLSGSEFDDAGLGKKTVLSVAQDVYGEEVDGKPTVSDSLTSFDGGRSATLTELRRDMNVLDEKGGSDMKGYLEAMLRDYNYPSIVSFACLDDEDTGLGDSTIAKALGIKESLPFYDGVVEAAADPNPRTRPEVGKPFEPQLAVPESRAPEFVDGMKDTDGNEWRCQLKIDGYRCLLHVIDGEVTAFSRRQNNITPSLPELQELSFPSEGSYILDGEIISENSSYSETAERIGRKAENVERNVEMEFAAFDLLLSDDEHIHENPYSERVSELRNIVSEVDDSRLWVPELQSDFSSAKQDALDDGEEGLILKRMDAPYEFGKRSSSWVKFKFDSETVDLVISGFAEGEGAATGTLGYVELESADGVAVGHSGSGFTDAERDEIWQNREDWLGRTIEVEARGLGSNDKLRMPIFKRDRSEDGEPDSFDRIQEVMKDI